MLPARPCFKTVAGQPFGTAVPSGVNSDVFRRTPSSILTSVDFSIAPCSAQGKSREQRDCCPRWAGAHPSSGALLWLKLHRGATPAQAWSEPLPLRPASSRPTCPPSA